MDGAWFFLGGGRVVGGGASGWGGGAKETEGEWDLQPREFGRSESGVHTNGTPPPCKLEGGDWETEQWRRFDEYRLIPRETTEGSGVRGSWCWERGEGLNSIPAACPGCRKYLLRGGVDFKVSFKR